MRVLVTGGGGFIGSRLVEKLLEKGALNGADGAPQAIDEIVACDQCAPPHLPKDTRYRFVEGDVSDAGFLDSLLTPQTRFVFHLAAVVSVAAEEDFDLGMRINLHGILSLLELCRALGTCPRLMFASSAAVYGGDLPQVIEDGTALVPQTSYGMQKAVSEFFINDYSRRGLIDGRCLRLPTVAVRPGKPNKAASSFASSIIREPLEGREVSCPVAAQTEVCILSPRRVVENFIRAAELPSADWGYSRVAQLPGITLTVADMTAALERIAGERVARRVRFEPDAAIEKIVSGWPTRFDSQRARQLGFHADNNIEEVLNAFIEDDLKGRIVS
jgi:nucleoside-diphosphate-sugar epimerase